ncbi:MAG: hypothetical protein ACI8TQ_001652 [Planctomycetota bacterium]|jgi:hypothetical protein
MSKQESPTRFRTLLTGLVLLLTVAATPAPDTQLKARDHEKLGGLIGKYFEAKGPKGKGAAKALDKVRDEIAKIEKKAKAPFLSMTDDMEEIFYFAREYKDAGTKGRVTTVKADNYYSELGQLEYVLRTPKSYRASKGPYPLLLCLTDTDEDPEAHLTSNWIDGELLASTIVVVCKMPDDKDIWNMLKGGVGNAMQIFGHVMKKFAVDGDQVFLAGRGLSVDTAMTTANLYPHTFAGVIGRAGDMGEHLPTNFRNLPTYFAGGGANSTAFSEAAQADKIENCTLKADGTEADIWTWMQGLKRNPHPLDVSIAPTNDMGRSAYWVALEGFDPTLNPTVRATIDRDTNSITVVSSGVTTVMLSFNDLLVDLDKQIVVTANGVKHEITLPRRLDVALNWAYESGDRKRAYVNRYQFDMQEDE